MLLTAILTLLCILLLIRVYALERNLRLGAEQLKQRRQEGADLKRGELDHVFDRFFTSDQTRSGRNTGLGLAIVKALAGQMGGTVSASLDGETFTVLLRWKI